MSGVELLLLDLHTILFCMNFLSTLYISLASKFEFCTELHSAGIRFLPYVLSCMLNDSTFWRFLRLWSAMLYWGIYKNIILQASRLRFCAHLKSSQVRFKRRWQDLVSEKRVMLLSYCRLRTVCSFAQAIVTVEACVLKDRTVVKWLLLPRIFTHFALH